MVLMISWSRASAVFEAAPGGLVAIGKVLVRSVGISEVAGNEDRAGYFLYQFGGGIGASQIIATGDVSSSNQDWIIRFRDDCGRGRSSDPLTTGTPTMPISNAKTKITE